MTGKDREYCKGCGHLQMCSGELVCAYILDTGRKRPCEGGAGCSEHTKLKPKETMAEIAEKRRKKAEPPQPRAKREARFNKDKAREMYLAGASDAEIAEAFGVATITVRRWRYEHRMLRRPNNGKKKE